MSPEGLIWWLSQNSRNPITSPKPRKHGINPQSKVPVRDTSLKLMIPVFMYKGISGFYPLNGIARMKLSWFCSPQPWVLYYTSLKMSGSFQDKQVCSHSLKNTHVFTVFPVRPTWALAWLSGPSSGGHLERQTIDRNCKVSKKIRRGGV